MEEHRHQQEPSMRPAQLQLIREVRDALARAAISWWMYGGWAMDFQLGAVTREHADIEIFVWERDAEAVRWTLVAAGFSAPQSLHPDEGRPFLKDGLEVGATYLVRDEDGSVRTPGRWSDWPWRPGAFDGPPVRIDDLEVPTMSAEGMLDMKMNFHKHPHGAPLREKDVADIARLEALIASRTR